jgi:superfamily II DNA or RNA helicase/cell fate (sporulation/competence/biofilm development) regulator YmcA (YheA/YmcA/DUF963 family)
MATGSGKTLILIKLVEILHQLEERGEIPKNDILILTYRDDLITQIEEHVQAYNAGHSDISIRLYSLKNYDRVKYSSRPLPGEVPVFIYRSDNLSDEAGTKVLDFRDYENGGKWYVLLDEAHKGDRDESKRQHIYSILSRNGFLFNFSATFTDERDVATTVFNFNLAEYIRAGYGKHICVMEQEIRAFRDWEEDFSKEEKQKIVLKALLSLAYIAQDRRELNIIQPLCYHKPLLVMMGHTVNTDEADVKLFFRALAEIGRGVISSDTWEEAKDELWGELSQRPEFMFEEEAIRLDTERFREISIADLRELVFNSRSTGEIEVLKRPSNTQEVAFKLKTAEYPFALIKIGDISEWLTGELSGYEINETFVDESFFEKLDGDDTEINILMGSRTFYEGWDSNRPNVMCFVNIGMGTEARKFILQSVGRGVRIEPIPDTRQRVRWLMNAGTVSREDYEAVQAANDPQAMPIETLFIYGTNRSALQFVIENLDQVQRNDTMHNLALEKNPEARERTLYIPVFELAEHLLVENSDPGKFEINEQELALLERYFNLIDDRVLMAKYGLTPGRLNWLRHSFVEPDRYFRSAGKTIGNLDLLVKRTGDYFGVTPKTLKGIKELNDEIRHYRQIKVSLREIDALETKIETIRQFPANRERLRLRHAEKQMTFEELEREMKKLNQADTFTHDGQTVKIKHISKHYYIPTIFAESDRVDYIQHVIKEPSEIDFIKHLEEYVDQQGNLFGEFDWWLFSKLDEHLDNVALPYYDPRANRMRNFKPDFIFWLQKNEDYFIVFIDPKGTSHTDYEYKIDGYSQLFEDDLGNSLLIDKADKNVRIFTFLHTDDVNQLPEGYKKYWFDKTEAMLKTLLETTN